MQYIQHTPEPSLDEQLVQTAIQAVRQLGAYYGFGTQGIEILINEQVDICQGKKQWADEHFLELIEEQAHLAEEAYRRSAV